jgi:hypothetical protein
MLWALQGFPAAQEVAMRLIRCSKREAELAGSELRGSEQRGRTTATGAAIWRNRKWLRASAFMFAWAFLVMAVNRGQQVASGSAEKPVTQPGANRPPDTIQPMQPQNQPQKKASAGPAAPDPKKQLTDESAQLLKLANELKAEVDKTDKDTLSISVIRKADEIERLARVVKEKMKLTVGAN